jgi:hypothetical protein
VTDTGLRGPGKVLDLEAVDPKVVHSQALIPLGLTAVQELSEAEVARFAGERD